MNFDYDLLVIGSGPAGQRAAIQAAKLGKRVAIVERRAAVGGICINTGTILSKTLREAVLYLSGYRQRGFYGEAYAVKQDITMQDLLYRTDHVISHELDVTRNQLARNQVQILNAEAAFVDPHTVRVKSIGDAAERTLTTAFIVIATGTTATRDASIPFDGETIFLSDDILSLHKLPRTLVVIGGGVIGIEYASIFAALGVRVTLVDRQQRLLSFVDSEIAEALAYHLRENRMTLWLGETVSGVERIGNSSGPQVKIQLASGKQVVAEKALYSIGRTGATQSLHLEAAGLKSDERGRIKVNEHYQTEVPHIYAAGM